MIANIYGQQVYIDPNATEHDGYNFPFSKNRSQRVWKKLTKKFGCYERRKPAAFQVRGLGLIMHPVIYEKVQAEMAHKKIKL